MQNNLTSDYFCLLSVNSEPRKVLDPRTLKAGCNYVIVLYNRNSVQLRFRNIEIAKVQTAKIQHFPPF